jgi:flagellar L-ring protein precursor FlgH
MRKTWPHRNLKTGGLRAATTLTALLLSACAADPKLLQAPLLASAVKQPLYLERPSNGAIYQPYLSANSLFSNQRRPQAIGDTLKVDISETLKATQKQSGDISRENKVAVKGPGDKSPYAILSADASASGSDSFKGTGNTEISSSFNAQMAVTVINVLPNGHLVIAGERSIGMNGSVSTLRFSGTLDPRDIQQGNVISSKDVVNAYLENVGQGDVSEASSRNWLQRVLTRSLSVW